MSIGKNIASVRRVQKYIHNSVLFGTYSSISFKNFDHRLWTIYRLWKGRGVN